ncbi:MAG: undecaprenyl-diphosphate phosphatase [Patescibacteria group bacterium]
MQGTLWHLGQAAIIGLVQGLTEFIPISSSGHLIVVRELLHIDDPGNFFDAVLHLATLLAVLIYFRRDWWDMLRLPRGKTLVKGEIVANRRLLFLIALATIPALIAGYFGNSWIEHSFRSLPMVAGLLLATGLTFWGVEHWLKIVKTSQPLSNFSTFNIGLAQAIAIFPGISRSGMTILAGLYSGLNREMAARFSFLLAVPIIAAAGGYSLYQSISQGMIGQDYGVWLVAFGAAFIAGWASIYWLLQFLKRHSLIGFAYYLIIVGSGLLVYSFWR